MIAIFALASGAFAIGVLLTWLALSPEFYRRAEERDYYRLRAEQAERQLGTWFRRDEIDKRVETRSEPKTKPKAKAKK